MATKYWAPNAAAIAQVNTITVAGTIANGQVYTVTINGKAVAYTAVVPSDTNTIVTTNLVALLQASAYPEFGELTFTNPTATTITATAQTAGVPFTQTSGATGTGTLVTAATIVSSGPNDVSLAANWNGGLPAAADDVYITNSSVSLLYNLSALSAITVSTLTIDPTFTGQIGLPSFNPNGYNEYRPTYWAISATTENYLPGSGGGSSRIQRNQGSVAWSVMVAGTGPSSIPGRAPLLLKGTSASNTLEITKGNVGSAIDPGETSNWSGGITIGYTSSPQSDVTLTLGSGCTVATLKQNGGTVNLRSNSTTITQRAGTLNIYSAATVTTLDVEGGTCFHQSSGTVTTATIGSGGKIDASKDPSSRTFTSTTLYGKLVDPNHVITHTNAILCPIGLGTQGATIDWGTNFSIQRS